MQVKTAEKIEILVLQDNYIDLVEAPSNAMVARANPVRDGYIKNSVIAEHGFSALVKTTDSGNERVLLFDFGYSPLGVVHNMDALGVDSSKIEELALSHGHMDHTGGLEAVRSKIGKPIKIFLHPFALDKDRYLKFTEDFKLKFPELESAVLSENGLEIEASTAPREMIGGYGLFLGEIPRSTPFETGMPLAHYADASGEHKDDIPDDTSLVFALRDKGIVVLSGCAHSGIINTIRHAQKVTGIDKVHAVIGGFHLGGSNVEAVINSTIDELKAIAPDYIVPCHCTGRTAMLAMERELPGFVLSMAGTKFTFA
ncbi:MAG TPA: MBL fold metallo-hydrolase [Deltaproteobacteria bacterium]|nr:MBL fold metallo-hydrolase [Deltaproteobacteria bacterium]HQH99900.1 MBL fold metallo-hydrolase [Deltaproteobacteria bacterium]HQJ07739.1 MBL fold metallo-hydrolase [Deltaproteobacteria bacterium]